MQPGRSAMYQIDVLYQEPLPAYLRPSYHPPQAWNQGRAKCGLIEDFIMIAEFSELEGPKPLVVYCFISPSSLPSSSSTSCLFCCCSSSSFFLASCSSSPLLLLLLYCCMRMRPEKYTDKLRAVKMWFSEQDIKETIQWKPLFSFTLLCKLRCQLCVRT